MVSKVPKMKNHKKQAKKKKSAEMQKKIYKERYSHKLVESEDSEEEKEMPPLERKMNAARAIVNMAIMKVEGNFALKNPNATLHYRRELQLLALKEACSAYQHLATEIEMAAINHPFLIEVDDKIKASGNTTEIIEQKKASSEECVEQKQRATTFLPQPNYDICVVKEADAQARLLAAIEKPMKNSWDRVYIPPKSDIIVVKEADASARLLAAIEKPMKNSWDRVYIPPKSDIIVVKEADASARLLAAIEKPLKNSWDLVYIQPKPDVRVVKEADASARLLAAIEKPMKNSWDRVYTQPKSDICVVKENDASARLLAAIEKPMKNP